MKNKKDYNDKWDYSPTTFTTKELKSSNQYKSINLNIIKDIDIVQYAEYLGFTPKKVGNYMTLKEHDSVRFKDNKFVQYSSNVNGSVIDFHMTFTNDDFKTAIKSLANYCNYDVNITTTPRKRVTYNKLKEEIKKELVLPEKDNNIKNIYAYLCKTRGLDKQIVANLIHNKNLYQSDKKSCVFVSYDNNKKPCFCNIRGTNTEKKFVQDVIGCDYNRCFYVGNNKNENMIVAESVIDGLSVLSYIKNNKRKNFYEYNLLALSGVGKTKAILTHIKENPQFKKLFLCFDNDEAGQKAVENVKELLKENKIDNLQVIVNNPPLGDKDWNDYIVHKNKAVSNDLQK